MKTINSLLWLCWAGAVLGLALSPIPVEAATSSPPDLMTYQGYLVDNNGTPLGNTTPKNYDVVFRIWKDQLSTVAADRLWTEQQTITIDKGYFSVLLGEGAAYSGESRPALSTLFTGANASDRFIEVLVKGIGTGGTDVTITPRLRFLAAPYAFLAQTTVNAQNLVNSTYNQVVNVSGSSVGINKASPTSALDVSGTVTATTFAGSGINLTSLNATYLSSGIVADARLSTNVAKLNATQTFTGNNTFTGINTFTGNLLVGGDLQIGTSSADYQHLRLGGGNSSGYLYGSYHALNDGIHLGYNYYYDAAGVGHLTRSGGATSRLTLGYGKIELATAGNDAAPSTRLLVNASGNVGIGTITPGFPLTFANTLGDKISLWGQSGNHYGFGVQSSYLQIYGDTSGSKIVFGYGQSTNLTETMRIQGNGYVGINNSNPQAALHVIGQAKISDLPVIGDEYNVQWDGSTKTLGRYASSRRYKENIQPMEAEWSALLSAQPVSFNLIGQPERLAYGFIAEDLDELGLKPLVVYDEAGRPDGVRYEKVGLYLLQIVKAQQEELKEKDTRLQALEQSVADLKAVVSALAEKVNAIEN